MEFIFFNEQWNEENEKQEHAIDSISEYRNRTTNIHIDKKRDYLSDLYFFEQKLDYKLGTIETIFRYNRNGGNG